jgi:hypothetical protein
MRVFFDCRQKSRIFLVDVARAMRLYRFRALCRPKLLSIVELLLFVGILNLNSYRLHFEVRLIILLQQFLQR